MFNKNICELYHTASFRILSTFTFATFSYVISGYISLGLVTLRHFFVPACYYVTFQYENDWRCQVYSKQLANCDDRGNGCVKKNQ